VSRLSALICLLLGACVSGFHPAVAIKPYHGAEIVTVPTLHPDGKELSGLLFRTAGSAKGPAVLMMHGCAGAFSKSGKLKARPRFWAEHLSRCGYVVLVLDSFNPRGVRHVCQMLDRPVTPEDDRPYDAISGLRYLQALDQVDAARVALMGWSHGAMSALNAIRVQGRASFRPPPTDFRAAVAFYPGCRRLSGAAYTSAVPLLMLLGGADEWTPARHCVRLANMARGQGASIRVQVYDGAHHSFDHPNLPLRAVTARSSKSASGTRTVHVGTHEAARKRAISAASAFLAHHLGGPAE